MLVKHDAYGTGRVVGVGGYGALRTVKIRFSAAGRTLISGGESAIDDCEQLGERTERAQKRKLDVRDSKPIAGVDVQIDS